MPIETVELTLAHVGLGRLREKTLMSVFATAQAHRLTAGTGITVSEITDTQGLVLYPGYFSTHLTVPPSRLLSTYGLWDRVAVGVDVKRYGQTILESSYALGRPGELDEDPGKWDPAALPMMRGAVMFIVDGREGEPRLSAPRQGSVAELPVLTTRPRAMEGLRRVDTEGSLPFAGEVTLSAPPIAYPVLTDRDVAPGHAIMFAHFVEIMDHAERQLLTEHVTPPFPEALVERRALLEREIYYLGNCRGPGVIDVRVSGRVDACEPAARVDGHVHAAVLSVAFQLYLRGANTLLVVARARKLLVVPADEARLLRATERLCRQRG